VARLFEEFPDYRTQGETLEELQENLRDLYQDLQWATETAFWEIAGTVTHAQPAHNPEVEGSNPPSPQPNPSHSAVIPASSSSLQSCVPVDHDSDR
jgi:hypothetical protein